MLAILANRFGSILFIGMVLSRRRAPGRHARADHHGGVAAFEEERIRERKRGVADDLKRLRALDAVKQATNHARHPPTL